MMTVIKSSISQDIILSISNKIPIKKTKTNRYADGLIPLLNLFCTIPLYKKTIIIASIPMATDPINPITGKKLLAPSKKISSGRKQVKNQLIFSDNPKSYHSVRLRASAMVIKDEKQQIMPNIYPSLTKKLLRNGDRPDIASLEVASPDTPSTVKIKKI